MATSDGGFVISWTSNTFINAGDGSGNGVFARRFDLDGTPTSGEILLNEQTSGNQFDSDLAALANGDFVSVWTSVTSGSAGDGNSSGVFSRLIGEPTTFVAAGAAPEVAAFSAARTFDEAVVNAGPVRLDADSAVAFSDSDSTDFDGGRIVLGVVAVSEARMSSPRKTRKSRPSWALMPAGQSRSRAVWSRSTAQRWARLRAAPMVRNW